MSSTTLPRAAGHTGGLSTVAYRPQWWARRTCKSAYKVVSACRSSQPGLCPNWLRQGRGFLGMEIHAQQCGDDVSLQGRECTNFEADLGTHTAITPLDLNFFIAWQYQFKFLENRCLDPLLPVGVIAVDGLLSKYPRKAGLWAQSITQPNTSSSRSDYLVISNTCALCLKIIVQENPIVLR